MFEEEPQISVPQSGNMQQRSAAPKPASVTLPVVPAVDIHTMPQKFVTAPKKKRSLIPTLLISGGAVILLAVGGLYWFAIRSRTPVTNTTNQNLNTALNFNTNTNSNTNSILANSNGNTNAVDANTNGTASTVLKQTVTDPDTSLVLSTATVTMPAGSLPANGPTLNIISLSPSVGAYATSTQYAAIGAVYILTPAKTQLAKKATVQITYSDTALLNAGAAIKESSLTIAYWNGTEWTPINSVLDEKGNSATAEITEFYSDGIAIVAPKAVSTNANTNSIAAPTLTPSHDTDNDGLTDQEELLYGTSPSDPDTDHDSYRDGQEVLARYNPNGKNSLTDSGLVKLYENPTFRYSILYPASWTPGALNGDKLVLFTSITGEFVQVSVQENSGGLSAREWYQSLNPSVSSTNLRDITVGSLTGVLGPDNLNIYLADKANIYQITYNIGIKSEANYLTTFAMIYTSFQANITLSVQPTNISTNSNTNTTNANTNTNTTNTNTNSNSNTNSTNGNGSVTITNGS